MKRKKENKKEHKKKITQKKQQGYIAALEKRKKHFHKFFCNSIWKHSSTGLSTF